MKWFLIAYTGWAVLMFVGIAVAHARNWWKDRHWRALRRRAADAEMRNERRAAELLS